MNKLNIQIIGLIIVVSIILITNSIFNRYSFEQSDLASFKRDTIDQILKDLEYLSFQSIYIDDEKTEYLKTKNDTIYNRLIKLYKQEFELTQKIVSELIENKLIEKYSQDIAILSKFEIDFTSFVNNNENLTDWLNNNSHKTISQNKSILNIEKLLQEKRKVYISNSKKLINQIYISDIIQTFLIIAITILIVIILYKEKIKYKILADNYKQISITKDKFFSIISHDLKNPFNSIFGFSELILKNSRKYPIEKIEKFVENIYYVSKNTYNLLENLLEWSRLQSKKLKPNFQSVNINEIIKDVFELLKHIAEQKFISLTFESNSTSNISADREMVKTVLRNLITNAIKFTDVNGQIILKTFENNKILYIEILDNGIGMDETTKNNLFKLEVKNSIIGTNGEKGTGLGLILCKELTELNNGKITVESEIDKGTKFTILLPIINR